MALVLDQLRSVGPDRMIVAPGLRAGLRTELERFFSARDVDRAEVLRLLKLIAVLDERDGTREVADELTEMLRGLPLAVAQLSLLRGRPSAPPLSFESRRLLPTAPHVERRRVAGELKLSELRRPDDPQRLRAWSSARGGPSK